MFRLDCVQTIACKRHVRNLVVYQNYKFSSKNSPCTVSQDPRNRLREQVVSKYPISISLLNTFSSNWANALVHD